MPELQLAKEVTGEKLIEILRRAASETGFKYRQVGELTNPPNQLHILQSAEKGTCFVLDLDLALAVEFREINPGSSYQTVSCSTYLCQPSGVRFRSALISNDGTEIHYEFEAEYDILASKVVELSREA